jgi:hypothetical protein
MQLRAVRSGLVQYVTSLDVDALSGSDALAAMRVAAEIE